ncbi:MAG: hypothetical protein ACLSVD_08140, partial [Eggerthellaceae bacterium]
MSVEHDQSRDSAQVERREQIVLAGEPCQLRVLAQIERGDLVLAAREGFQIREVLDARKVGYVSVLPVGNIDSGYAVDRRVGQDVASAVERVLNVASEVVVGEGGLIDGDVGIGHRRQGDQRGRRECERACEALQGGGHGCSLAVLGRCGMGRTRRRYRHEGARARRVR